MLKKRKEHQHMGDTLITKRILMYIEEHLDKELSLEKIAKELNYSKFYIARTFKDNTGMTLYKYIQGRRLEEAARKLAETKAAIVDVAFEAGYSSQQAFTQAFRCVYACTPQEYRRRGVFTPKQNRIYMGMRMKRAMLLFLRATSQVAMLAWIFGDCREGQIPRSLLWGICLRVTGGRAAA